MKIGGIQKLSFIDYPKKLSSVIFTQGCPFRCHFCHNSSLVIPEKMAPSLLEEEIFSLLKKRRDKLDGVVISGGEPTAQKDLKEFILEIKKLGFLVKLDTSGIHPKILENLLKEKLLDYVAMDIKATLEKYPSVINASLDPLAIKESIHLLIQGSIDYEFRTTLVPFLHPLEDLLKMAELIQGAKLYVLQTFSSKTPLNPLLEGQKSYSKEDLLPYIEKLLLSIKKVEVR